MDDRKMVLSGNASLQAMPFSNWDTGTLQLNREVEFLWK